MSHTGTLRAYLTSYSSVKPQDIETTDSERLLNALTFSNTSPDCLPHNWILVGAAEITFIANPIEEIVPEYVEKLQEEIADILRDAEHKTRRIQDQINDLRCLTAPTE